MKRREKAGEIDGEEIETKEKLEEKWLQIIYFLRGTSYTMPTDM